MAGQEKWALEIKTAETRSTVTHGPVLSEEDVKGADPSVVGGLVLRHMGKVRHDFEQHLRDQEGHLVGEPVLEVVVRVYGRTIYLKDQPSEVREWFESEGKDTQVAPDLDHLVVYGPATPYPAQD